MTVVKYEDRHNRDPFLQWSWDPAFAEVYGAFQGPKELRLIDFGDPADLTQLHEAIRLEFQKKGGSPDERFLDQLLTMALIEARSCERFKRLSEGRDDKYLRNFYRKFMESEAGHYTLFINLAEHYIDRKVVRKRWAEWLKYEKELMKEMEIRGDRIH